MNLAGVDGHRRVVSGVAGAPSVTARKIAMVAGEASGDLLAASVLKGIQGRGTAVASAGIGGPAMAEAGFECWWSTQALSVNGYFEVLASLPRLLALRARLRARVLSWQPDLFVGVDAPDFNLELERKLKVRGTRVAHFIGPSIWAWRGERIEKIRQAVDHMLLVFPFEPPLYERAGIPATYVGHPLADVIPVVTDPIAARTRLALDTARPTVALLPGSRRSEVSRLAPCFVETALWLHARVPDIQFVLPAAGPVIFEQLQSMLRGMSLPEDFRLQLVLGRSHDALEAADTVLVASGTATLEAAFFRRPMVVAYRLAWSTYQLMRRMEGYLPWIALPNILANEWLVPEFIQDAATAPALGAALLEQLGDAGLRERLASRFGQMHTSMRLGCGERAAAVLEDLCNATRG